MNDLDRLLDNQAMIMGVLIEILTSLPSNDEPRRATILRMVEVASKEAYEYAHRGDGRTIHTASITR